METGKGAILLGSHLGSFEVLRALGVMERSFPLKVLMDTAHNQNITRFFDALNPDDCWHGHRTRPAGYIDKSQGESGCRLLRGDVRRSRFRR